MQTANIKCINNKMVEFAKYFTVESKFRDIPEQITQEASKITEEYFDQKDILTPSVRKRLKNTKMLAGWRKYFKQEKEDVWFLGELTTVDFIDLKTNEQVKYDVYIALGNNNTNYAICDDSIKSIIIYDSSCKDLDRVTFTSVMIHELTHGFQQHKQYSKKYTKLKTTKKTNTKKTTEQFYKEPIEIDAFMTEVAFMLNKRHNQLKTDIEDVEQSIADAKLPETKKVLEKRLQKRINNRHRFLQELNDFIRSPYTETISYKELASTFERFDELFSYIHKNPKTCFFFHHI